MAGEEIIDEGVIRIGVDDNTVPGLAAIDARIKVLRDKINREGATIQIKGDISNLDAAIRDAKLKEKELAAQQKALELDRQKVYAEGFKTAKDAADARLKEVQAQRAAITDSIPAIQRQTNALKDQYTQAKAGADQLAANLRTQTAQAKLEAEQEAQRQRSFIEQQRRAAFNDAAAVRSLAAQKTLNDLQAAYDKKQQEIDNRSSLPRAQRDNPSEKAQIEFDDKRALVEMALFEEKARLLGGKITKRVELDTSGVDQKFKSFLGLGRDSRSMFDALGTSLATLSEKFKGLGEGSGGARVNIAGLSVGIHTLIIGATTLSPLILGLAGGIGSLISVMGAGIAGAAGLGAAGLAGFGLAAIGVKSALSNQLEQLTTFKAALNAYQTAQLTTGPAGPRPPTASQLAAANRRQAQVPLINQRIGIDQQLVTTALTNYGAGSIQAQRATLTLATAQQRLSTAQAGVVTSSNKTQIALNKMNMVIAQSDPAMRAAERGWLNLSSTWQNLTGTVAKNSLGQILADAFSAANANVKWFARDTNTTLKEMALGFHTVFADLAKPGSMNVLNNLFTNFNKSLPSLIDGVTHLGAVIGRLLSNFSNYLPNLAKGFDTWATGLDTASKKSDGFSGGVHTMVEAFKSLGEFVGTALRTLLTFFSLGIKPGQGLLDGATATLDRWNASMETTGKSKVMDFFKNGATTLSEFIGLLAPMIGLIVRFGTALGPALNLALGWADAISKGAAALVQFKPAQYIVGGVALLAIITRLGRGFYDAGKSALEFGANTLRALSQVSEKGFKGAFSSNFNMSGADKLQAAGKVLADDLVKAGITVSDEIKAAILSGSEEGARLFNQAMAQGGAVAGGEMRAGTSEGGAVAAAEERAGVSLGGLGGGIGGLARVSPAAGAGETALLTEAGAAGSVAGGAKLLGGSLLKGGLLAGAGIMGSQLIGSSIGGKTGSAVSTLGTGVSAGAGVGSAIGMLAPELGGPIVGAVAGGLLGGLATGLATFLHIDSRSYGKKLADGIFGDGFGGAAAANLNKSVTTLLDTGHKAGSPKATAYGSMPGRAANAGGIGQQTLPTPEDLAKKAADYTAAGQIVAKALEAGWNQYKFQSEPTMIMQLTEKLKGLPPYAQAAATESAVKFAMGLEKSGRLAKGSAQQMLSQVESNYHGFINIMGKTAKTAAAAFTTGISLTQAETNMKRSLDNMRADFPQVVSAMDTTKGDIVDKAAAVVVALKGIVKDGTGPMKKQAQADINELELSIATSFKSMMNTVHQGSLSFKNDVSTNTTQAYQIGSGNFKGLATNIAKMIGAGAEATQQGLSNITDQVNKQLAQYGEKGLSPIAVKALSSAQLAAVVSGQVSAGAVANPLGHATGGRVPGPVTGDTWTMLDPSGRAAGKVAGGELLIANRHTESRVDSLLAKFGTSLSREVAGEGRPHNAPMRGFATGGTLSQKAIEGDWIQAGGPPNVAPLMAAIADAESSGIPTNVQQGQPYGTTGWGLWQITPGNSMPQFGVDQALLNPLANARAALSKYNSQGLGAWTTYTSGAYRQFLHGGIPGGAGTGAGAAAVWNALTAPQASGSGAITDIVQGAMNKVIAAANAYGQAHMPAPVGGGGGGAGPVFAPTSGPLPSQVQWALQAAQNIAARNLPYGHDGAGWNMGAYDCSSYVSTVMDAAGIWPKWTYYTAAGPINAHTDPGPGKYITIGTWGSSGQQAHTMMEINGHFFESGGSGGGPHVDSGWSMTFDQYRHPRGFAMGGRPDDWTKRGNPGIGHPGYQPTQAQADDIQNKSRGKALKYAGAFAQGGSFTAHEPTMGLFGENGPETVVAIPHASTGNRFIANAARRNTGSIGPRTHTHSHAPSPTSSHHSIHLSPAQKMSKHQIALDTAEEKAKSAYENYNYDIHHNHPAHYTGGQGHRKKLYHPGGPTPSEKTRLMHLYDAWQHAAKVDDHQEPSPAFNSVTEIPAKDRIGGVGTADIQQALTNAQTAYSSFDSSMRSKTNSKGNKVKPSKQDLATDKALLKKQNDLQGLLDSANTYVQDFANMETEIGILGQYMDGASASTTDTFTGYDPGMGKTPLDKKRPVKKTWAEWKAIRMYWENKHTMELKKATADVRNRMINKTGKDKGKMDKNVYDLQYVNTLAGSLVTSQTDQAALSATTDTGMTLDAYIQSLPYGAVTGGVAGSGRGSSRVANETPFDELQRLQYDLSLAQGMVQIDNPGTPQREDIISMGPEDAAAKNIATFYQQVFGRMQADPKTKTNYPLLTQASDAYNAAYSNWQGIDQQIVTATQSMGPSQLQINDTARAGALQAYGSNFSPVAGSPGSAAGGAAAQGAFSGAPNAMTAPGNGSTVTPSGNTVNITNSYLTQPADPHTYSQALAFELGAAI